MNKRLFAIGLVWLSGLVFVAGFVYLFGGGNSLKLWRLERAVASVAHPPGTVGIARASELGLLVGNGNHCDFFVAELRDYSQTDLTPDALKKFYADTQIKNPMEGKNEGLDVAVVRNGKLEAGRGWSDMEDFIAHRFGVNWPRPLNNRKVYVTFNFSVGYDPGCDIRCH